jgi:hypothetical protein
MQKWIVIVLMLTSMILIRPGTSAALVLDIATSKQVYNAAETLEIGGNLSNNGVPVSDALVLLQIDNPKSSMWVVRTLTTGPSPAGPFPVEVLNVTTTDSNGRPKDLFNRGEDAGFKVAIQNNAGSPYPICVMVNLFYSTRVPFKLFTIYNGTLGTGPPVVASMWPITIPANAAAGQATAHVSIISSLPNETGIAYAPEKTGTFRIVTSDGGYVPPASEAGTFNFTIPLLSIPPWVGNYSIYARTRYGPLIASDGVTFGVKLAGDLNHDGRIDMKDVAIVAKPFGTRPGDALWNAVADVNQDGKVDMKDLSIVAKEFGMTTNP